MWAAENLGYRELMRVQAAPPTAELEPIRENVNAQVNNTNAFSLTKLQSEGVVYNLQRAMD